MQRTHFPAEVSTPASAAFYSLLPPSTSTSFLTASFFTAFFFTAFFFTVFFFTVFFFNAFFFIAFFFTRCSHPYSSSQPRRRWNQPDYSSHNYVLSIINSDNLHESPFFSRTRLCSRLHNNNPNCWAGSNSLISSFVSNGGHPNNGIDPRFHCSRPLRQKTRASLSLTTV